MEAFLHQLDSFDDDDVIDSDWRRGKSQPRLDLEQYSTSAELATSVLEAIDNDLLSSDEGRGDAKHTQEMASGFASKLIADLGMSWAADLDEKIFTKSALTLRLQKIYPSYRLFKGATKTFNLGCGCGVLMLGAVALGATLAVGFDIDAGALRVCRQNIADVRLGDRCELIRADVSGENNCGNDAVNDGGGLASPAFTHLHARFDVVLMNPPFGTKNNAGRHIVFENSFISKNL